MGRKRVTRADVEMMDSDQYKAYMQSIGRWESADPESRFKDGQSMNPDSKS